MGNIEGYRAPLAPGWIEKKHQLQLRILARMRALGMKPVLPAFAGYVPKAFADRHPEARIYRMRQWEGFASTCWLDPADPLFATLAKRFMALYTQTYGAGGYYLADVFNEMVPPIAEDGHDARATGYGDATATSQAVAAIPADIRDRRLAAYSERLYRSIADAAPGATWVMQGWLFGADKAFWTPPAIKAFPSKVPDDRMPVLDIGNDRYPGVWRDSQAFNGKNWICGGRRVSHEILEAALVGGGGWRLSAVPAACPRSVWIVAVRHRPCGPVPVLCRVAGPAGTAPAALSVPDRDCVMRMIDSFREQGIENIT